MSYQVIKKIQFCYGHRLLDYDGKCRHLHGHNALVEIIIEEEKLDHRGMVIDFNDIKKIATRWIDENLDHNMLLRQDDPMIEALTAKNERCYIMKENPTAENIAHLIGEELSKKDLNIAEVRVWETPTSMGAYRP